MKEGWRISTLGELGPILNGNSISEGYKDAHFRGASEGTVYLGTKDVSFDHQINYETDVRIPATKANGFKLAPANTVLVCAEGGSAGRKVAITDREVFFGNKLFAICPTEAVLSKFVFYHCLTEQFAKSFKGAMAGLIGGVSLNKFKNLPITLPPLLEQQHIVGALDKTFAGLATATANTEKNLNNARELFDSYLDFVFVNRDRWLGVCLSEILSSQPRNGWSPPAQFQTRTGKPVLTLSAVTGFEYDSSRVKLSSAPTRDDAHYWLETGELLITRSNTQELVGHVAIYNGNPKRAICCDLIMKMKVDPTKALTRFVYYNLRSAGARAYFTGRAHGASSTMKKISKQMVQNILVPLPSLDEQGYTVMKLDELSETSRRLAELAQKKLLAIADLKQAILKKAFSGELASKRIDTKTASFAANVLLLAYERHKTAGRELTFGHKKAQKLLHLVEAAAGVDLGRDPLKDAAGPNDFDHMLRATDWAEQREIFKFNKSDKRYIFQRLKNYKRGLEDAKRETERYSKEIGGVIDFLLPMNSEEAEILATVYAAWNNLIVKSKPVDDEAIVREAREDWHPEKMDIPRHKFFDAITLLRKKKIVPTGQAKLVREKYLI